MDRRLRLGVATVASLLALLASYGAIAQEEYPPPSSKGRVVLMASGATGMPDYRDVARRIATLGYKARASDDAFARTDAALKRNMN
jgi:hypothetical protein